MLARSGTLAAAILAMQALLIGRIAWVNSPVLDELPHLAAGLSHWEFGSFELYRVNPPLVRMMAAIPVRLAGQETDWNAGWSADPFARPEFPIGRRFARLNGQRIFWLMTIARWACLPFVLLGGAICYQWAKDLYGPAAGLTAVTLWGLCPQILAWGGTICPDVPAAAMGLLAGYTFWRWLRAPTGTTLVCAGAATGLAWLTKSTWILLFLLWPLLWCFWRATTSMPLANPQDPPSDHTSTGPPENTTAPAPSLPGLVLLLVLAIYVVNLGYGFSGLLRPLGEFEFISRALTGHTELGQTGNRFRDSWPASLPVPLPADFVLGVDVQRYDFEAGKWSYLLGEQKHGGWWWYYLYGLAVKTPLGTLALMVLALACAFSRRGGASWRDVLVLLAPAIAVLVLVSSQTGFNRYLRYVVPALPFLFVATGRVTFGLGQDGSLRRACGAVTILCLVGTALSSLRVWPHSLTYFNELAGGPENGHLHLLDANLDWGQGLLLLRDWLNEHPDSQPLFLADFGWVAADAAGIQAQPVPRLLWDGSGETTTGRPGDIEAGWYVVSVNHVQGYRHYDRDRPVFTWLQEFHPIARLGNSLWVYHLSETDVQAFRDRHRRRPQSPGPDDSQATGR